MAGGSSEWSTKTKIIVALVLIMIFAPIYMLTEGFLDKMVAKQWLVKDTPDAPKTIYRIAWIYKITQRPEKQVALEKEWLKYYGGDWEKINDGAGWMPWEINMAEAKMAKPWAERPHPLTPTILLDLADWEEKGRSYIPAKTIYGSIIKYFPEDAAAVTQAQKGLMRDKVRTF
jgi:hypothetical protein